MRPPAYDGRALPTYDRRALRGGIVHLGLGAFARAHLAAVNDDALDHAGAALDWGITGVSLRSPAVRDALAASDGRYTLTLRDGAGDSQRQIGCVLRVLVAPESPRAVIEAIAAAPTRIVSLTVTEKGYCHHPATRAINLEHADIAHDLAAAEAPRSAIGFIVRGLALRRARGLPPLTLMSLDNLPANGHTLQGLVLAFAQRVDGALADWIERGCTFPNSMVDRIVPRADGGANVVAEPFLAWAVEDHFAAGRPDWSQGGAIFVARAEPYEKLKLRLLNGAHSAIAYLGVQAGWPTVDGAIAQLALARFIDALLRDEVAPTVAGALPGFDLDAYRAQLLRRFANPVLGHRCMQIAMDGSQKLPQRWLDTVRERLAAGAPVERLALAVAAWLMHLRGHDEAGRDYAIDDPLAAELQALASMDAARALGFTPVFGTLGDEPRFVAAVQRGLGLLREHGVVAALERSPA